MIKNYMLTRLQLVKKKLRSCRRELMHYHCQKVEPRVVTS